MYPMRWMFLLLLSVPFFFACGDDARRSANQSNERAAAVMLAQNIAKMNESVQDLLKYSCRCFWSVNYSSEDQCLSEPGLNLSRQVVESCMIEIIDEMPAYDGDLSPLTDCMQASADSLDSCVASAPDRCSEANWERRVECYESFSDQVNACDTLFERDSANVDEDWFEEFYETTGANCGLLLL